MQANAPEIRYARNGDASIAYQVAGHGSIDLVLVPGFVSNLDVQGEQAAWNRLAHRLASFSRLIQFDPRGNGLSERHDACAPPDLEIRSKDLRAVLDAAGSGRAVVLALSDGVPTALMFAASFPDRARSLIAYGGYARYRDGISNQSSTAKFLASIERDWGRGRVLGAFAPGHASDSEYGAWCARLERQSATPGIAWSIAKANASVDVRGRLAGIRVPTLVVHRADDVRIHADASRLLARHIPGARYLEVPGRDHPIWAGDADRVIDAIEEFLTGGIAQPLGARILCALHAVRIVGSERMNSELGDRRWAECIEQFRDSASSSVRRLGGHVFRVEADTLFARFDGPARATRCAIEIRRAGKLLGLRLAQGLHVGEVEIRGDSVTGVASAVAGRIAQRAAAGDILATSLVAELAVGSGLHFVPSEGIDFEDAERNLKMVAVATEQHLEPVPRREPSPDIDKLSIREREVLSWVADGLSNPMIAAEMRLSEHTVKRHVANILLKLALPTRAAAAALAARQPSSRN